MQLPMEYTCAIKQCFVHIVNEGVLHTLYSTHIVFILHFYFYFVYTLYEFHLRMQKSSRMMITLIVNMRVASVQ